MKNKLTIIIIVITLFISNIASAAYVSQMEIGRVHTKSNGYVYFHVTNPPTDTCEWYSEDFRFDVTTAAGQAMLSNLLASKASGAQVDIWYNPSSTPGTNQSNGCLETTVAVVYGIGQL